MVKQLSRYVKQIVHKAFRKTLRTSGWRSVSFWNESNEYLGGGPGPRVFAALTDPRRGVSPCLPDTRSGKEPSEGFLSYRSGIKTERIALSYGQLEVLADSSQRDVHHLRKSGDTLRIPWKDTRRFLEIDAGSVGIVSLWSRPIP